MDDNHAAQPASGVMTAMTDQPATFQSRNVNETKGNAIFMDDFVSNFPVERTLTALGGESFSTSLQAS
ncbi:hypothetical protein KGM_207719 [Danaus plexippus plexippus]|uniref:Uncharacterized protein n=1 Tax=Danaus plexippus plexippus TaxID=278856 RepID=A0A212FBN4_DANPL|nr:hypothetical protein KGM_207719 [Danaus plexippus plexippus]